MESVVDKKMGVRKPRRRRWRLALLAVLIGLVLLVLGGGMLVRLGIIEPIPLTSWAALRTYIVDRTQPRLVALQRAIWPVPLTLAEQPTDPQSPTLADIWEGRAEFVVDIPATGLPMGESDTVVLRDGRLWSYVHASDRSAGVVDSCGDPVPFPGCAVIYQSDDGGMTFALRESTCLTTCNQCPCALNDEHIDQQQYPRVVFDGTLLHMVYEYRGMVMHRTSEDGLTWEAPTFVPATGFWARDFQSCPTGAAVGDHPHTTPVAECLMGGPPGIYIEGDELYMFVGMGQNPGAMGCYRGRIHEPIAQLQRCTANPLFVGATEYGSPAIDATANVHFDFRTISSAEVQRIGDRYYMLYEGVRGPGPGDPGDTQFGLGLARSTTDQIDGPWEKFAENPLLVDLPANIGIGHADLVVMDGVTYLYTSLDGVTRSRLVLQWQ
ncbi:MAG: hypothetical protein KDE19_00840 [Caldilineaceae bacterium]|nr:hypothetical protein [Caldilineaceae bacterium]